MALLLAYDGTDYRGYQRQLAHHEPTIQGVLEGVISRLSGAAVKSVPAGRTDAGVHAQGQVVTFDATRPARFGRADWHRALNALLPVSIAVRDVAQVAADVNARYSALGRHYRYRVLMASNRDPLRERYVYRVADALDVPMLQAACDRLTGEHDFATFGQSPTHASGRARGTTVRHLRTATVRQVADEIWFDFAANAFLTGMVRRLVGTLLLVGIGRLTPDDVATILAARKIAHAGPAAPPHGLTLMRVDYPPGTITWPAQRHDGDDHDHL